MKRSDLALLSAIFVLRLAVIALPATILLTDPDSYLALAKQLAATGTYGFADSSGITQPTAFRPPLYPATIALTLKIAGQPSLLAISLLHALLATCSALFMLLIGRRLAVPWTPLAAVALSLDPLLIRQSQLLMTETLATTMALFSWWLCIQLYEALEANAQNNNRKSSVTFLAFATGISFGIATLTRPTAVVWLALTFCAFLFWMRWQRGLRLRTAIAISLGWIAIITPWIVRNQTQLGKPIWATTHGGYTLLLANNPIVYDHLQSGSVSRDWNEDRFHNLWAKRFTADPMEKKFWSQDDNGAQAEEQLSSEIDTNRANENSFGTNLHREVIDDQLAQSVAVETIKQRPSIAAWSVLVRLGWLWTPLPNPRPDSSSKWIICLWYLALYGFAIAGLFKLRSSNLNLPWLCGWLLVLSITMVHAMYWSNMRMRSPALPMLYLLACSALPHAWPVRSQRKPE